MQQLFVAGEVRGVEIQVHMPGQSLDPADDAVKFPHVGRAARGLDETETYPPEARLVQVLEILLAEGVIGIGDAAQLPLACGDGRGDRAVVGFAAVRIQEHGSFQAESGLHALETRQRRLGGASGPRELSGESGGAM